MAAAGGEGWDVFKKVSTKVDFPALELEVLEFWRRNDIAAKSMASHPDGPRYVFYEGPPTANGLPHIGHVIPRVLKDLIPRYHSMLGCHVPRKGGWDTHGLPVELEVEKEVGISGKPEIERFGVEEFVKRCKESVFRYKVEWERLTERIAFWLDLDDAYVTYHDTYIESVWWALRQIWDKGLLYEGHKVVPYCPRCGTALSSHELAQGYTEVHDPSVFVRFPLLDEPGTSFLAWTTTPWTLISNAALAVHPDERYLTVACGGERLILAAARAEAVLGSEYTVVGEARGRDLLGRRYRPAFEFVPLEKPAHRVVAGSFVSLEEGSGIVHIAPAFGDDDMRLGVENDLPVIQPVDAQGRFSAAVTPWAGMFVKDADPQIIADLRERGLLLRSEVVAHNYPMCWRCDTPLIYYARQSWFIRTTAIKEQLLAENARINWVPAHIRDGRFGNFLEDLVDWCLSRERYWGTPLPIWRCACGHTHCVGSIAELRQMARRLPEPLELHKPYIDEAVLACPACGSDMRRVNEVIDCWFDSGSMPFAQYHYPFENRDVFEKNFPADYISEAIDQTRGWFFSLLAISTLLFGRAPYKNVLVAEHGLDEQGIKMSKHKGNVLDPAAVLDSRGADALRWFLVASSPPWHPKRFSLKAIAELHNQTLGTLWNVYAFFVLYANIDGFDPARHRLPAKERGLLDRWLLSRLQAVVGEVRQNLDAFEVTAAARALAGFIEDLSNWYVRRGRRRYWKSALDEDKVAAYSTLHEALTTLCRLLAPFVPFMTEAMYQNLVRGADAEAKAGQAAGAAAQAGEAQAAAAGAANVAESVHLCPFPAVDAALRDEALEARMAALREYVRLARAARNRAVLKVRQPLAAVTVVGSSPDELSGLEDLLLDELNIKRIIYAPNLDGYVEFAVKPRWDKLGPRLGADLQAATRALQSRPAAEVAAALDRHGKVTVALDDGRTVEFAAEEVEVQSRELPGYKVEGPEGRHVALHTELTEELVLEGLAREMVNRIERMRKEFGLEVEDHIETRYVAGSRAARAFTRHDDYIRHETLSRVLQAASDGLATALGQGAGAAGALGAGGAGTAGGVDAGTAKAARGEGVPVPTGPDSFARAWEVDGERVVIAISRAAVG